MVMGEGYTYQAEWQLQGIGGMPQYDVLTFVGLLPRGDAPQLMTTRRETPKGTCPACGASGLVGPTIRVTQCGCGCTAGAGDE